MRQPIKAVIVVFAVVIVIATGLFTARNLSDERANGTPGVNETPETAPAAPQIVAPQTGTIFVESGLTLAWTWLPGLADRQMYAVRVWFGEEAPREVWTPETSLDAQEMIDSYSQEIGDFYWQVAVIQAADGGGFERMVSDWSPMQTLRRVRHISPTPYPAEQQSNLTRVVVAQGLPSATAVIDYTRDLIYDNTLGGEGWTGDPKNVIAIQMMYEALQGRGEKPHLLCDGRATALMTLLREMGIDSRLIFLYGDNTTQLQEHTMLEVFNPDTQQWELHDPLYNVYYIDAGTQARASIERVVFGGLDTVSACDAVTGSCSPEHLEPFRKYFEAFRYGYSDTFWVNPDRFNVSKRFPDNDNANLAEYLTGNPRDMKFYFDSWTDEKP